MRKKLHAKIGRAKMSVHTRAHENVAMPCETCGSGPGISGVSRRRQVRPSRGAPGRGLMTLPGGIVREETCAVRQDAFCKVHDNFVTAKTAFRCPPAAVITGQIIYILKRLVTKKNVTVAPLIASPYGDTHSSAICSGRAFQGILNLSRRTFRQRMVHQKT